MDGLRPDAFTPPSDLRICRALRLDRGESKIDFLGYEHSGLIDKTKDNVRSGVTTSPPPPKSRPRFILR